MSFDRLVVSYAYSAGIDSIHLNPVLPIGRAKYKDNHAQLIEILNSIISVATTTEFKSIKEHSVTLPSELLPLSLMGVTADDFKYLQRISERFSSAQFICNISHGKTDLGVGWGKSEYANLQSKTIVDAFNYVILKNQDTKFTENCKDCLLANACDPDSFVGSQCEAMSLQQKIQYVLDYPIVQSPHEALRNRMLNELSQRCVGVTEVAISITDRCNGNCNFCQIGGSHNDKGKFQQSEITSFLKDSSCLINITGGEPFLRGAELISFIKELKKSGHAISILTNLSLINEAQIVKLSHLFSSLDTIQVSIYAHDPFLHQKICGRNDWKKINEHICRIIDSGINMSANLTLTSDNVHFVRDVYLHYRSLGVSHIAINGLLNLGRAKGMLNSEYIYDFVNSIYEFLSKAKPTGISLSIPIEVLKTLSNLKHMFNVPIPKNSLIREEKNNKLVINYDGTFFSQLTGTKLGSVANASLDGIMLLPISRDLSESECSRCHSYEMCQGSGMYDKIFSRRGSLNFAYCDDAIEIVTNE